MNPGRRSVFNYKFVEPQLKALKGLGTRLDLDHKEDFEKAYGNLLAGTGVGRTLVYIGVGIKDYVPFVSTKKLPKSHLLAKALHLENKEVGLNLNLKGGTHGFTLNFLVKKAITFVDVGSWITFNVVFALLIYGIMLFSSMEDFVDSASIHIFLSKNPVPTLLDDTYYSIHIRTHKKMDYDNVKIIMNCGSFPNVPLIGTKGGINYNPKLALRKLGYPLLCMPDFEHREEFVLYKGFDNLELLRKIVRAWREACPQGRSELGKKNCITKEAYTQWVKDRVEKIYFHSHLSHL
ncbi:uncharacterized protein LOC127136985 [Lathyrus oleraceus]|uniref:uncharacterized protein LOC127136985 n=1 Tax=Pisum sativum TaxID=3888 RepID=UPI0021D0EF14|nr:uncharacterized protein LOC127136985 [Pisum sativum]